MTDIPDLPIVPLPGYEGWADAYEWGGALDKQFPGQDADEFAYACGYNDTGPAQNREITDFVMAQRGENDGADWIWHVTFADATRWIAQGGCDYTGWDCMSDLTWTLAND